MRARGARLGAVIGLTAATLALVTAPGTASAGLRGYHHYVALGDSYASGPGIPAQVGTPAGCARSDHNYAHLLATSLRVKDFTDVTCGGATTVHMTQPQQVQGGANPAQFGALRANTDLVTLTIGGNDIGFGEILATCGKLALDDPAGNPCQRHYAVTGSDELTQRVDTAAAKIATVLRGIRSRSPHATVLVVGYLRILPPRGGCFPGVPFAAGDTPYFDGVERHLNEAIHAEARAAGARFVDPYSISYGHDACQQPGRKWVEGLLPASPAAVMHPNTTGMGVVAAITWLSALFG